MVRSLKVAIESESSSQPSSAPTGTLEQKCTAEKNFKDFQYDEKNKIRVEEINTYQNLYSDQKIPTHTSQSNTPADNLKTFQDQKESESLNGHMDFTDIKLSSENTNCN